MKDNIRIAILGGGPSGLFMFKRFVDANNTDFIIDIFERKNQLGAGMPYSHEGASDEHITNVSGNEIPELVTGIADWIRTVHPDTLRHFHIDPDDFNDYKVLPRLLFGQYLTAQFSLLKQQAAKAGIQTSIYFNSKVTDITDHPQRQKVEVEINGQDRFEYDHVIICTGHHWPVHHEGKVPGYFDSPYPPAKLAIRIDHPVAIKGSSLTAIDAIRTLTRYNGSFLRSDKGELSYQVADDSRGFRMVMHSRNGLLPALRFHLEDSHLGKETVLSKAEVERQRESNGGFLSLDYVFEKNFKDHFIDKEPEFYAKIKDMKMEAFVEMMMDLREQLDPFHLLRAEYAEAAKSIKRKESVYWKEMLGVLSFAMNYPAKYFPAEDMQRLQKVLMPLISIVIAFVPQSSAEQLLALHGAGVLDIVSVGDDSQIEVNEEGGVIYHYTDESGKVHADPYQTFIDSVGQPHLSFREIPYEGLRSGQTVSPARLLFQDPAIGEKAMENGDDHVERDQKGNYYLKVAGISINDNFQALDAYNALNERIYVMAVPYIGGVNPDYSGLDFCEAASSTIMKSILLTAV